MTTRESLTLGALLLSCVSAGTAQAATYKVGPGRTYTKPQDVVSLLNPGDVVEVDGNATYPGDLTFGRPGTAASPIVVRGVRVAGKRPLISGGTNTVHFKTVTLGSGADHYVFEGFEVTGGASRCIFHQSDDLTLRDLVVHDCPKQGILGADWGSGSLTLEHSEIYRCGAGTSSHQIYIGMDQADYPDSVFRMQFNWVHDGLGGNNVKSRATRNEIYYNRIEGAYYHELELIGADPACCAENAAREDSDVVGNLIVKKPPPYGPNPDFFAVRVGGDGTGQSWARYRFVNNTFVMGGIAVFRIFDGLESVEMHNNVFYRYDGLPVTITRTVEAAWKSGVQMSGSNNWMTTGSTTAPPAWTGTLSGANPGFTNATTGDYSPATGSPLVNAGSDNPTSAVGFPFPGPLFPPGFHPPGLPGAFGTPNPRPADATIDIGAYEQGSGGPPQLSISDVSVTEGNSGTASALFNVTLSPAASVGVTVSYSTANGTAAAGSDYVATSGTLTFAASQTTKTITVPVTGDTAVEGNETFYVTLSGGTNAGIARSQATGTILNDDVAGVSLSINDVTVTEGNSGTTNAVFTVTLSATSTQTVTVGYATVNGTATAGSDYTAQTGNLSFTAGQTSKTIAVVVNGDTTVEANETFVVNLSGPVGATLADSQGQGTITNDDATPPPSGSAPVVWTSAVGVTVTGNSLTKTAATAWGNAGAISTGQIASGDGFVEFTASETTTYRMLGLSNGNTNASYEDVDFALYQHPGQIQVYESGTLKGSFGSYAAGNTLRVAVVGGAVKYSKNGTVFYTSTKTPTYPLLVDAALYNQGATLNNAVLSGASAPPPPSGSAPVVWTSAVGVTASGSSLTKTAVTAWGNAGAVSTTQIPSGDGYVEFTASETNTYRMLGLSNGNTNASYDDIDFAIYQYPGQIQVYESGTLKGSFGAYATGNTLRVAVVGGVVKYSKNGTVFYTSTKTPTYPLLVDAALYNQGATLNNAVLSGASAPPPPSGSAPVVWASAVGVTVTGNSLTKTAATAWGNAGAISTQQIASGGGYVEFTASETTTYRMLGLSNGNTNASYEDIDFAIYEYPGKIQVYESGILKGSFGSYAPGDKLRAEVVGGVVKYSKNGTVFYTSTKTPTYPLLVDAALYNQGSTLNNAVIDVGP